MTRYLNDLIFLDVYKSEKLYLYYIIYIIYYVIYVYYIINKML